MRSHEITDILWNSFAVVAALIAFLFGATMVKDCTESKREITGCYIQDIAGKSYLIQNREWTDNDPRAGPFESPNEALEFGRSLNCTFSVEQ